MGSRPLRMKVRCGCPPRVLSPPPHRTQSWWPCLPGQPWASGWRSTDRPVPSPRGWTSSQLRPAPVPFFLEVHEELTKSWMATYMARSHSSTSSILSTLDGGVARGYAGIPQVERAIAVHLCPWNAATWRNRPRLPSKACELTASLAAKAYSAAGQAASTLHAIAILQVHQAKVLKQVHEGWCRRRSTSDESHSAVPREGDVHHGGPEAPSVAQPGREEGRRQGTLYWRPHLPGRAVQRHRRELCTAVLGGTAADRGDPAHLPRRNAPSTAAPGARPQSARCHGRPPELLRSRPNQYLGRRVEPLAGEARPSQAPSRSGSSTKRSCWGQPGDVGICSLPGDGENSAAPSPGGGLGGEYSVSVPTFWYLLSQEREISFSSGFSGPWDDSVQNQLPWRLAYPTVKLRWALFVTYTIIQSIMRSEMCSLHLTHPSGAVGSRHCGEQLGVRCLSQGSHLSRGHFLPEPGFEPTTSGYLRFQVKRSILWATTALFCQS